MPDHPQWRWIAGLEVEAVAIVLDKRAQAAIARRRARGKGTTPFLRLERVSVRAGVPWTLAVGWAPRPDVGPTVVLASSHGVEVHAEPRVAHFARWCDLTISAARLGPWEWLVMADPVATFADTW